MQNRPTSFLHESNPVDSPSDALDLDRNPLGRLIALFVLMVVPLVPVTVKLFQLQASQADVFIAGSQTGVTESFEEIPTTNGRILIGGTVLAEDSATYRLKMHYRWLEEPVDDLWLRMKAWSRLNKSDRRNKERVKAAEQEVLAERTKMWNRLTEALAVSPQQFQRQRQLVQNRVERIIASVEERQQKQRRQNFADQEADRRNSSGNSTVDKVLSTVEAELTTPPKRRRAEPVVVTEEHDYHVIAENVPFEQIAELVTRPDLYPGLDFELVTRREYPQGAFASHIVGYRQSLATEERDGNDSRPLPIDEDILPGDFTGRTGIERSYDHLLRGRRGQRRIVRNADGEIIRREIVREARPGSDVTLALDEPLQRRAEQILDRDVIGQDPIAWRPSRQIDSSETHIKLPEPAAEIPEGDLSEIARQNVYPKGACLIAMNVHTGELLAAAAAPRFDLRLLVDHNDELWQQLQADPRQPMFPRLTKMALPPGSVFKTLTAIAALEEPNFNPDASVYCRGYLDVPHKHRCYVYRHYGVGHGEVTLEDAICRSCNVFFYSTARDLGARPLVRTAQRMGFGQPTGIDLPDESSGNLPQLKTDAAITLASLEVHSSGGGDLGPAMSEPRPQPVDPLGLAIGQSTLTVTPLQIVRLMAAVANGGELVTPRVVRQVNTSGPFARRDSSGGRSVAEFQSAGKTITGLSERTLHLVRSGLEQVVASPRGTGYKHVRLKSVSIAGKTGTAETGGRPDHAWFAGYVPAERPQIAFVAVVEHGGSGGVAAGPLAKKLVEEMLKQRLVVPPAKTE
ncbi:MAG: penicillin-binding transpeptidase domain-containing protein [Planctomycetota bacterium]|nr:penicillin-binding transpeptidase domain-containing protein [Planctomycetota bacterium]MDA1248691.1 penicillin-binding transpeptidase domain-containing protein [Planctomycetota bacterium]